MSQDNIVKMKCSDCERVTYWTRKNRRLVERSLELKKFCRFCRKHVVHKEGAKK